MIKVSKILLLAGLMIASIGLNAQKFGHLNTGNLLEALPKVKEANKDLESFQVGLVTKGQEMVKAFQSKLVAYQTEAQKGILSAVQSQTKEGELRAEQEKIATFDKEVQLQVMQKREALLKPILESVDQAIQAVGKENGYTFIFDTSLGSMLYAPESEDVTALVKAKLGI